MRKSLSEDFRWFDLSNYKVCANFSESQWASALHRRRVILNAAMDWVNSGRKKVFGSEISVFNSPLLDDIVRGKIEVDNSELEEGAIFDGTCDYVAFWDEAYVVQFVRPLSVEDASYIHEEIKDFYVGECAVKESFVNGLEIPYQEDVYPVDFVMDQQYCPVATVQIDLSAPDNIILKELKNFLPSYRAALKESYSFDGKITPVEISKLGNYSVLPYLDMKIWCCANDKMLTDSELSAMLFPYRDDHANYLAQTVKPFIKKILNPTFISALGASGRSFQHK